ncbi:hypothetical protein V9L16_09180 [Pseudomonas tolaasii]|uniref:hypothetical protein n=1 Tax=Pseudomonas tolaasii TaxID=29442 RepID=UPI0030CF12B7
MNPRRSQHTNYEYLEVLVHEFKENFFIIQRGQQGVTPNPAHGPEQRASENVKLYVKLRSTCTDEELGEKILAALNCFDTIAPNYDPWDNSKLARQVKTWLNASNLKEIDIKSRTVKITKNINPPKAYSILPFDNFNSNPWCSPMEEMAITLDVTAPLLALGNAVRRAFTIARHHPSYTTPSEIIR